MKRFLSAVVAVAIVAGFAGCSDETGTKSTTTNTSPGGTSKTTVEVKKETSGENPPPAPNP